ncbi:hypothetical protein [Devosia sp. A16]|uniref:hypothetical protein n=1 Tax=Devosia sp. A16 TaxID=1736675 RepID=UPI000AD8A2C5|nr:hypothetical protein [Devosia sp. A16]
MSDNTVFIPPGGRSSRNGAFIPPLLLIPLIAYNFFAFLFMGGNPAGWSQQLLTIPMVSGVQWSLTAGDLMLVVGLVCLFFEVLKSTNTGRNSVIEHMLSVVVFVIFLVEFLLVGAAASSVFFILMMMAIVDVVAGFTVSITGAGRDVTMGG